VDPDGLRGGEELHGDVFADEAAEHGEEASDELVEIDGALLDSLAACKEEELACEGGGALGRGFDLGGDVADVRIRVGIFERFQV